MAFSVFINYSGTPDQSAALSAAFLSQPRRLFASEVDIDFMATYRPAGGDVPSFSDGPGAPLLVELNLPSRDRVDDLLHSGAFRSAATPDDWAPSPGISATVDVFETVHYPLPDHAEPPARTAPLSFVVRYYRPVDDQSAFVDFYTRHHPPLLARFPGIRNVLCYLPVDADLPDGVESSGSFLGNEVVFDDLDSLNRALASDVLDELKADGRRFAPFGHNTHHAMRREDFDVRAD